MVEFSIVFLLKGPGCSYPTAEKKIEEKPESPSLIVTITGVGYKFSSNS
jgi:hypothetical protein